MSSVVNVTLSTRRRFAWQNGKCWRDPSKQAAIMRAFWARVNRTDAKDCWLWTGHVSRGYGIFHINGFGRTRAHCFSWFASRGRIPAGQEVCHSCDVGTCVNPDHLFLGTHRQNHLDAVRKGRKKAWGLQKLDATQVRAIRARVATGGERHVDIAADYGIARHTVGQIANRKSWAHLTPEPSADELRARGDPANDARAALPSLAGEWTGRNDAEPGSRQQSADACDASGSADRAGRCEGSRAGRDGLSDLHAPSSSLYGEANSRDVASPDPVV